MTQPNPIKSIMDALPVLKADMKGNVPENENLEWQMDVDPKTKDLTIKVVKDDDPDKYMEVRITEKLAVDLAQKVAESKQGA